MHSHLLDIFEISVRILGPYLVGYSTFNRELKQWRWQRQQRRQKTMIWLVEWGKNNRAARAARFLVQFFDVVCQITTWKFKWRFQRQRKNTTVNISFSIIHARVCNMCRNHCICSLDVKVCDFLVVVAIIAALESWRLLQRKRHFKTELCGRLRTVPTIVIAHTFCASPDTRISYRQCLLIQGYFCAV